MNICNGIGAGDSGALHLADGEIIGTIGAERFHCRT